jgi:hypothetical protein
VLHPLLLSPRLSRISGKVRVSSSSCLTSPASKLTSRSPYAADSIVDFSLGSTWTRLRDLSFQYAKTCAQPFSPCSRLALSLKGIFSSFRPALPRSSVLSDFTKKPLGDCKASSPLRRHNSRSSSCSRSSLGSTSPQGPSRRLWRRARARRGLADSSAFFYSLFLSYRPASLADMRATLSACRPHVAPKGPNVHVPSRPEDCDYEKILPAVQAYRTTELSMEEKEMLSLTMLIAYGKPAKSFHHGPLPRFSLTELTSSSIHDLSRSYFLRQTRRSRKGYLRSRNLHLLPESRREARYPLIPSWSVVSLRTSRPSLVPPFKYFVLHLPSN